MKKGINKVILVGNLGNAPEVKNSQNGGTITIISLATSDNWKDKQTGETKEKTEWHRVVLFGKLAEIAGQYLTKGSQVYFEGKLQTSKWKNQSGQDKYTTEVVVDSFDGVMQMLGGKKQSVNEYENISANAPPKHVSNIENTNKVNEHVQEGNNTLDEDLNDDIPF